LAAYASRRLRPGTFARPSDRRVAAPTINTAYVLPRRSCPKAPPPASAFGGRDLTAVYELELRTGGFYELRNSPDHATVVVNDQYRDRLSSENRHSSPQESEPCSLFRRTAVPGRFSWSVDGYGLRAVPLFLVFSVSIAATTGYQRLPCRGQIWQLFSNAARIARGAAPMHDLSDGGFLRRVAVGTPHKRGLSTNSSVKSTRSVAAYRFPQDRNLTVQRTFPFLAIHRYAAPADTHRITTLRRPLGAAS
jgi:hypothetical protein